MNAITQPSQFAPISSRKRYGMALLIACVAALAFAPLAILGPAIGWPASLRNTAAAQLTAIAANASAVALGYGVYALYSLAIFPLAVVVAWRVIDLHSPWAAIIIGFGALSALARVVGILRWLTVMPVLSKSHATGDPAVQATNAQIFDAINAYGGGIGELLGVALFGGLWLLIAMLVALKTCALPKWLCTLGIGSALLQLAIFAPAFGIASPIPVAAAVTSFAVWLIAFAVVTALAKTTPAY
jgi:hypothetical protein